MNPVIHRFIEEAGNASQSFGVGRVVGQIYAFLYFSTQPRSLNDMQEGLGISKGSASMGVRQLEQWSAVRKVWVHGDRKDYYEANDWLGEIAKNVILDLIGKRFSSTTSLLKDAEAAVTADTSLDGDREFICERIRHLARFHDRAAGVWNNPFVQKLTGQK